jgi:hypothetical protein
MCVVACAFMCSLLVTFRRSLCWFGVNLCIGFEWVLAPPSIVCLPAFVRARCTIVLDVLQNTSFVHWRDGGLC